MPKTQLPTIYIDVNKNRVRIFRSTLNMLGNPSYVQLLVNPSTLCIAVIPTDTSNKSLSHKVNLTNKSYEIHSKYFINKIMNLYTPLSNAHKLRIEGSYSERNNTAFFSLSNAICRDSINEDEINE